MKTKYDAVITLVLWFKSVSKRGKSTKTADARIARALVVLGLEGKELLSTGQWLTIWKEDGSPLIAGAPSFADASKWRVTK